MSYRPTVLPSSSSSSSSRCRAAPCSTDRPLLFLHRSWSLEEPFRYDPTSLSLSFFLSVSLQCLVRRLSSPTRGPRWPREKESPEESRNRRSGIRSAYVHTFTCRHNAPDHRRIVIQIVAYSATIVKRQCIRVQAYRPGVTVRDYGHCDRPWSTNGCSMDIEYRRHRSRREKRNKRNRILFK